ncbi:PREDICTED: GDSL esterase/lipase At1g06990 [Tarenaya hassleriana]|uniref:GDSL esterase/lipase At1g06990 n=1 Tax=Tarenaya hassleriana TaxID=28532 RepID=UPI00053C96B0|nr:PREDICTED: GDSL esterase/lipase At1g06990 [Tarenaya hassleriana]
MSVSVIIIIMITTTMRTCHATNQFYVPKFPAILVFGDSTVDSGNNNHVDTVIRANFFPYGRDFPGGVATGRFSNGKLIPDFVASQLGIKDTVPPFLDPALSEADILTGVSFASAGSGFDGITNSASRAIPVVKQTEMFGRYVAMLRDIVGEEKAAEIIGEALVIVSAATNDFNLNFYDLPSRRLQFTVGGYQDFILTRLRNFLQKLYDMGCRKMTVAGLPPVGCLPVQMTVDLESPYTRRCVDKQNSDSEAYNRKLKDLLKRMESNLSGSFMLYSDIYQPVIDMIINPQFYGLNETKKGCCGTGTMEASFMCNKLSPTCPNPDEFLFWDAIHPSQAVYSFISRLVVNEVLQKMF